MKILTVYFSHKGENFCNGEIKYLTKGNTEIAAEIIQKAVGGELFEVETVEPYSDNFKECCKQAKAELDNDARPQIKGFAENFEQYDIIFVAYPNWCETLPMCMLTFLDNYSLSGKIIAPLCTNEGSGMGRSEAHLKKLYPDAEFHSGLSVKGCRAESSKQEISDWALSVINENNL